MSRGRKKLSPAEAIDVPVNEKAIAQATADLDKDAKRLMRIEELYGDGDPYNTQICIQKARFRLSDAAESVLEAGKQIIRIKEHEPHGEFLEALKRIGIEPRPAQKIMQAAVKFSNPQMRRLTAHLNKTKLLELVSEEDEELQELANGGTLYGLELDDIERMSSSELRKALRKEKQQRKEDQETHERLLVDKNKKIDEYARRQQGLPAQLQQLQIDCGAASGQAISAIQKFTQIRNEALRITEGQDQEAVLESVGVTHLTMLRQVHAWLVEEIGWASMVFGGTKVEIRMGEPPADMTDEQILEDKNAGARLATELMSGTER
ncbi:MAG: hypothetical protein AB1560_01990 [Pseudomonadota bacterium]